jgi:hypothetical protein
MATIDRDNPERGDIQDEEAMDEAGEGSTPIAAGGAMAGLAAGGGGVGLAGNLGAAALGGMAASDLVDDEGATPASPDTDSSPDTYAGGGSTSAGVDVREGGKVIDE